MTMADTVAVMNLGKIEQMGSPAELYELPRTAFVANFLGQSNLVAGEVVDAPGADGTLGVDVAGVRVRVPADRAVRTSGRVLVGVRPEKIQVLAPGQEPAPGTNVLGPGRVTDIAFAGVSTQYQVALPGVGTFGVFAQNLGDSGRGATLGVGDEVRVSWAVDFTFGLDGAEAADAGTQDDEAAA